MDNTSNLSLQELKVSLIQDLKNRVDDRILEESNFLLLEKLINNASDKTEAIAIAELGTTYKRTGFHFDKKLERLGTTIKYLKRNDELSFSSVNDSDLTHKLIIGDNYDALLNLSISHKGKIDVIYIDPPYGKDDMGEFADTNYNNAITRDNLLSMLYPRLILAKQLLSEEGVIFCSIDDKNHSYVKCLFDDVFGEQNFIANVIWKRKRGRDNSAKWFSKAHEYGIIFAREKNVFTINKMTITEDSATRKQYKNKDNDPRGDHRDLACWARGVQGGVEYDYTMKDGYYFSKRKWLFSKASLKEMEDDNRLIRINDNLYRKKFFAEHEGQVPETVWDDVSNSADASDLIKEIFGNIPFDNPKPVDYIKRFLEISTRMNSVVLDFFAGSGTAGQAVLELNKDDGGTRTFILCTNNEISEKNPCGIAYDVTSKRLKRVMTGKCYDGTDDFEWIKKNEALGGNLEVMEIAEVSNIEQQQGLSPFDVIDEKLYGQDFTLSVEDKIRWVCENFAVTQKYLAEPKSEV